MNEQELEEIKEKVKRSNKYILYVEFNDIKKLLKYVEKQQKEIKARLEEIDSLYKLMSVKDDEIEKRKEDYQILKDDIEGHNVAYVDTPEFEENYISKDKIKEKIEEITSYAYTSAEERDCQDYSIQVLKELLGE